MAPHIHLFARDDDSTGTQSSSLDLTMIIGIVVACLLACGVAVWLGIHVYRQKRADRRDGAGGSSLRGLVSVDGEKGDLFDDAAFQPNSKNMFNRSQMTNVVMPSKAVLRPDATKEEIVEHFTAEGKLPKPFAPFSLAMNAGAGGNPARPMSGVSFLSVFTGNSMRSSVISSRRMSTASTMSSVFEEGHKREVRQLFNPALPDELVLSLGERVTLVQSYDDGWSVVGRDSLMTPGDVEMGTCPAWCFAKPTKGLKAERPIRTSSLGVTVTLDGPGVPRENIISWSNFA